MSSERINDKITILDAAVVEVITKLVEIQIFEERQPNGQWLKSITFRLPIIEKDMKISVGDSLDNQQHVETVVLMSRKDT